MKRSVMLVLGVLLCALTLGCTAKKIFEETYYVGVYDRQGRSIPQFYRYQVQGWAKFGNKTYFEAGLLPSSVAQSFETKIQFDEDAETFGLAQRGRLPGDTKGRYSNEYILYGPEGERQANQDLSLLIAINNNPKPVLAPLQALAKASSQPEPKKYERLDLIKAREQGLQGQVEVSRYLNADEPLSFEKLERLVSEQQARLAQ